MNPPRRFVLAGLGAGTVVAAGRAAAAAQTRNAPGWGDLPAAPPEKVGVDSGAILDLLAALEASPHEPHSIMIARDGHTVAGGWWAPYRADVPQLLYSLSKSVTGTAVGIAIDEGRLHLDDRVIDFFPDQRPATVDANLAALRLRHLLTMTVGHDADSTPIITRERDWVRAFLAQPIVHAPGSVFLYDSGASYMLSAIVQKVSGKPLDAYLRPRLFDPLGIADARWATCPMGINTGGWGLKLTTGALTRFGQLYLDQGRYGGRQIVSRSWVAEATRAQVRQPLTGAPPGVDPSALPATSDWHQGYGYQFWRCRHDAFRGDGAFGQYCIVLPDKRTVVALTSCTPDMQGLLNLVWQNLLPGLREAPLTSDPAAAARLRDKLAGLTLPIPKGASHSPEAARIGGRRFVLEPNSMGTVAVTLHFDDASCAFELEIAGRRSSVRAGLGGWREGFTDLPGAPPEFTELIGAINRMPGPIRVAAAAAWSSDQVLDMQWRYNETPHFDAVSCVIEGDQIRIAFSNSITKLAAAHREIRPVLIGRMTR